MAVGATDEFGEKLLNEVVSDDLLDFETWTRLISTVEHMYPDNIDKISLVYDSFLSEFPLCYGYWKKYAEHMSRLCSVEKVVQIFERAVESVPYSLGVWVDYCSFSISSFEDPSDVCRLFERGLSFVGKDYLCSVLWDRYIEFEYSQQHWNSLANIYIQTLKFPTKKLHHYHERFKKLVAIWEEETGNQETSQSEVQSIRRSHGEIKVREGAELCNVINDLLDPSTRTNALQIYQSIGEQFYHRACEIDAKVQNFEKNIRRPYFHVKPLDDNQLQNWHRYLDQVEMEDDFDWAVKLYERCLVSCAHYPEFWMRYVDFVDCKGGREIAANALNRATDIFLKNCPEIHLFSAWFKEKTGDIDGLRQAFMQCNPEWGSHFIEMVCRKANVEKRMGNYAGAASVYKEAIELAAVKRPDTLPMLYVHYARLQHVITYNVEATREILLNGIHCAPHSKLLLKELICFASMHDGAKHVDILESVMAQFLTLRSDVSGALVTEDQEELSRFYLEFLDSWGSIRDIKKAWNRHLKLFPRSVRVQSSLKKFAKAGVVLTMIGEGGPESFNLLSQKSLMGNDRKHLNQLPQSVEKATEVTENEEKYEQAMHGQAPPEEGNEGIKGMELVPSEVIHSPTKNEDRTDGLCSGTSHSAHDKNYVEAVKNSGLNGIQKEQDQMFKEKPPNEESHCVAASGSPGAEAPQKTSQIRCSSQAGGQDIERISSISGPLNPVGKELYEDHESPSRTSYQRHKDSLRSVSPDPLSDREGSQFRQTSYSRSRSEFGTARNSRGRPERSPSPRRRSARGNSGSRYHRERSLSPRRNNSRWHPEERWQREKRHRREFRDTRNLDNSRGHRDNRMQNEHVVVIDSTGQTRNFQQQTIGSVPQSQPVQSTMCPQAQINQSPQLSNEQYGNVQNSQLYNQMWQMYYHQQQQLLLQQQPVSQQQPLQQQPVSQLHQLQQGIPYQQQNQENKNQEQQQQRSAHQPPQEAAPNQQLYPQPQLEQQHQQQQINEQSQSLQQLPLQHLYPTVQLQQQGQQQLQIQHQQQPQVQQQWPVPQLQHPQGQHQQTQRQQQQRYPEQQKEVYVQQQQQQQQQQSYQYQHLQQQQYFLYLQQLHQYKLSQQQSGLGQDQKLLQKQVELPEEQAEQEELKESQLRNVKLEAPRDDGSSLVDSIRDSHQQNQKLEHMHASTSSGATGQSQLQSEMELPEIEGTYVEICD